MRHRERAFALFKQAGADARACALAVDLVITYLINLGNAAAARGWLARGERLAESLDRDPVQGWFLLMRGYLAASPEEARDSTKLALARARELADPNLELVALADLGVNLVAAGDLDEGMALLDEAMAGTMGGESNQPEVVAFNCCSMLLACEQAGDLERASQWCRVADEFMRGHSSPFLFARCRVHYGSLLLNKGRWERAESELRAALGMVDEAGPTPRFGALTGLATLRLRQGRLEEAEELLAGCEEAGAWPIAAAELRMARRDSGAAAGLLERHLERVEEGTPEAVRSLALLVEARIANGDFEDAEGALHLLLGAAGSSDGEPAARAAFADGCLHVARGRAGDAIERFQAAAEAFARIELPFDGARARLELARAEPQAAIAAAHARSALRAAEEIGATALSSEAASVLRGLGERPGAAPRSAEALTKREREVLALVAHGLSNPEIAERLFISRKTAAHHVSNILHKLDLKTRTELAAYAATRPESRTR